MAELARQHQHFFQSILSANQILSGLEDRKKYGKDWTKQLPEPAPSVILLPKSTEEVSKILAYCHEHSLAVVPSGGRTGLAGGALAASGEVVVNLEKMNRILSVDPIGMTVQVEAGVITQALQERVAGEGLFFPLDLASKGSSQIGGNIATNAGGLKFIRFGGMREQVLGLVSVLADGQVLDTNLGLRKNNCGYDFNHLMIGSEGTLGVITQATLRLVAKPPSLDLALIAVENLSQILGLLTLCNQQGVKLTAFEFFDLKAHRRVLQCFPHVSKPFAEEFAFYGLCEIEGLAESGQKIEPLLEMAFAKNLVCDAIIAHSHQEFSNLWFFRENITESLAQLCLVHKNDLSIPIPRLGDFYDGLIKILSLSKQQDVEIVAFGHIGDGNIHLNYVTEKNRDPTIFKRECRKIEEEVFRLVKEFRGSISAEHGIGVLKKNDLDFCVSSLQIDLMRRIKTVFDPKGILNPGKIF